MGWNNITASPGASTRSERADLATNTPFTAVPTPSGRWPHGHAVWLAVQ